MRIEEDFRITDLSLTLSIAWREDFPSHFPPQEMGRDKGRGRSYRCKNIKAIIFDWGRTLWDNEENKLFDHALQVLEYCAAKYKLALISIASAQPVPERKERIANSGLSYFFEDIEVVTEAEGKETAFHRIIKKFGVPTKEIAIVGDRMFKEIQLGNKHGCVTIWLQKGKFAEDLPSEETGQPTYTIHKLKELLSIL